MTNIADIEGIGPAFAEKLRTAGVGTVEALLERGGTRKGREELEQATGLRGDQILRWVNHADLYRIKGVAGEMSELLEAAGVDSVPELSRRVAANLHSRLVEINEQRKLVRRVPTESQVADWIEQAKSLPRAVSH